MILYVLFRRSKGENFSPDAVGYVQLRRDGAICTLHARVTPEIMVGAKAYDVHMLIDEQLEAISSALFQDCVAAAWGCKYVGAVLGWLFTKSSEKSVTSTESHWKKSRLSWVPAELKRATAETLRPKRRRISEVRTPKAGAEENRTTPGAVALVRRLPQTSLKSSVREFARWGLPVAGPASSWRKMAHHYGARSATHRRRSLGVDRLLHAYIHRSDTKCLTMSDFLKFCRETMSPNVCLSGKGDERPEPVVAVARYAIRAHHGI